MITLTFGATPWTRVPPPEHGGLAKATSRSDGRPTAAAAQPVGGGRKNRFFMLWWRPTRPGGRTDGQSDHI